MAIGVYFWTLALFSPNSYAFVMFLISPLVDFIAQTDSAEDFQRGVAGFLRYVRKLLVGSGMKYEIIWTGVFWGIAFYNQVFACWMQEKDKNGKKIPCCMVKFFKEYNEILEREKKQSAMKERAAKGIYSVFNPSINYLSGGATSNAVFGPTKTKTIGCVEKYNGFCILMFRIKGLKKFIFRPSIAELQKKVPEAVIKKNDGTTLILRSKLPMGLQKRLKAWNKM